MNNIKQNCTDHEHYASNHILKEIFQCNSINSFRKLQSFDHKRFTKIENQQKYYYSTLFNNVHFLLRVYECVFVCIIKYNFCCNSWEYIFSQKGNQFKKYSDIHLVSQAIRYFAHVTQKNIRKRIILLFFRKPSSQQDSS